MSDSNSSSYRGRLAPSPTGLLHLGHARTFWVAAERARHHRGTLILRNEDLDPQRCRPEFVQPMIEDLRWLGISWTEGPDCGGPFGPYTQSERRIHYLQAWQQLRERGLIYPCTCSRKDVAQSATAPKRRRRRAPILREMPSRPTLATAPWAVPPKRSEAARRE